MMIKIAAAVFALAAIGGLYIAVKHLRRETVAIPLALVHGAAAATGLVLLIVALARMGGLAGVHLGTISLGLFVLAALGGFFLFVLHLKGRELPKAVIGVHALAAVTAFVLLLAFILRG